MAAWAHVVSWGERAEWFVRTEDRMLVGESLISLLCAALSLILSPPLCIIKPRLWAKALIHNLLRLNKYFQLIPVTNTIKCVWDVSCSTFSRFRRSIKAVIAVFTSDEWFDTGSPWFLLFSPRGNSSSSIKMSSIDCWSRGLVTGEREKSSHSIASGRPVS